MTHNFRTIDHLEGTSSNSGPCYWKSNPINAWTGGNKSDASQAFFKVEKDQFIFQGDIPENEIAIFLAFVGELIDYRYMQYEERLKKNLQVQSKPKSNVVSINKARRYDIDIPYFPHLKLLVVISKPVGTKKMVFARSDYRNIMANWMQKDNSLLTRPAIP